MLIMDEVSMNRPMIDINYHNIIFLTNEGKILEIYDSVENIINKTEYIQFKDKYGIEITSNLNYIIEGYERN